MNEKDWVELRAGEDADRGWTERIKNTIDSMIQNVHPAWRGYMAMKEGDHWGAFGASRYEINEANAGRPRDLITVNQSGECAERMAAYLFGGKLKIHCEARRPQDSEPALLGESVLNDAWERTDAQAQIERAAMNMITTGRGWIKVWIKRELEESMTDKEGNYLTYEDYIKEEEVYIEAISPFHMIWDRTSQTGKPADGRWLGQIFYKSPNDVLNNQDYDQELLAEIRGKKYSPREFTDNIGTSNGDMPYRFGQDVREEKKWAIVEIWDKKFRDRRMYLAGCDKPLLPPQDWWEHLQSWPFFYMDYSDSLYKPDPNGMMCEIADLQYERDRMRTKMFQHRRKSTGGRVIVSDQMDQDEVAKYVKGDDVVRGPQPIRENIAAIEYNDLPADEYRMDGQAQQDINTISFIVDILRGAAGADRESATSTTARSQFALQVIENKKKRAYRTVNRVVKQMLEHMRAFYVRERIIKIAGPAGEYWGAIINANLAAQGQDQIPPGPNGEFWQPYTRDNLDADLDVKIELVNDAPVDPAQQRQMDFAEMQFLLNPNVFAIMSQLKVVNYPEYLRNYFGKYGNKDAVRWVASLGIEPKPVAPPVTEASLSQTPAMTSQPPAAPIAPPALGVAGLQQQNVQPASAMQGMMGAMGPMAPPGENQ